MFHEHSFEGRAIMDFTQEAEAMELDDAMDFEAEGLSLRPWGESRLQTLWAGFLGTLALVFLPGRLADLWRARPCPKKGPSPGIFKF